MTTPAAVEEDKQTVARTFGVARSQVERDHLISHLLGAIASQVDPTALVFFGGTALSRTHLADVRLSEDIDLIAIGRRSDVATAIERSMRRLNRSHGKVTWLPMLSATSGSEPAVVSTADGVAVQVQLLSGDGYPQWPTEMVSIEQRYGDAPPARMQVLTADSFAASKLAAWMDRAASRDLYDMWAMGQRGLITASALRLFMRFGPLTKPPGAWIFDNVPTEDEWARSLAHQTVLRVQAADAAESVRLAWERADEALSA